MAQSLAWEAEKTRVIDSGFRDQIMKDRVYTCEKHFEPEDVEVGKYFLAIFSAVCLLKALCNVTTN